MLVFLLRRLLRIAISMIAVSLITFGLLQLAPGSFADISRITSGGSGAVDADAIGSLQARYGDSVPVWQQYLKFMAGFVTANMGPSYKYPSRDIQEIIATAFPNSAGIAILAVVLALAIAVPLGVVAALRRNGILDYTTMFTVTALHSLPSYLFGVILILVFSVGLQWLPVAGWDGPQNAVLPVLALGLTAASVLARYVRSSMLEVLQEEYVTAALAKGGRFGTVIFRHALRNSLVPLVTAAGPLLATLMTGTVFVETLFQIPGLGFFFADAARSRDMPLLMGCTLFYALIIMVMNLLVDLAYGWLDPRIRYGEGGWVTSRPRRLRTT
ncbi:ABC transporter permease [Fodinicola feengrottensis]|uniref:ABC transporter permease n=1 Tax=Fodinicola feengrottensis TaxID=435914 RepID=A0ABP4TGM0_9ACTN